MAALWKGFTGKEVNAYEQGVLADFGVDMAVNVGFAGSAVALQKVFGKIVNAVVLKGIGGKGNSVAQELTKTSGVKFEPSTYKITDKNAHSSLPVGHRRVGQKTPDFKISNQATKIENRNYSGHSLDEMRAQGIMPTVVESTIKNGLTFQGKGIGKFIKYDPINNISVVVNSEGSVVTVSFGKLPGVK